jgi:NAD(P)-dependent dehydrogenase (short-subunit alcohol dehydrogenase family)
MAKTILITGSTDGLGKEVARRLAAQGHKVLIHGRNPEKGQQVIDELAKLTDKSNLEYFNADLSSLAEVKKLSEDILASQSRLDVLINNAGIGPRTKDSPRQLNKDGVEMFFAVNYLAGYLLVRELMPLLKSSAPARIINVASIAQVPINFTDPMLENTYSDYQAYSQSKLAQILHTMDLAEQLAGSEVSANSLHPATLMNTKMVLESSALPDSRTTVDDGADALENLIIADASALSSGEYYDGLTKAQPDAQAFDKQARQELQELSEKLITQAI